MTTPHWIANPPMMENPLQAAFQRLDHVLTGKHKPNTGYPRDAAQAMADSIVYLSDGGYSRIYGTFNESDVWVYTIGSESLEKAKIAWNTPEVQLIVERICTLINEGVQGMGK